MKKLIIFSLIFFCSCNKSDDSSGSLNEIISGKNLYVAGYINDENKNSLACYWKNDIRVDLGEGELTDITVSEGKVYSCGYSYGGGASYWIDDTPYDIEGNDAEAYSIDVYNGDVYAAGRDNGACFWKRCPPLKGVELDSKRAAWICVVTTRIVRSLWKTLASWLSPELLRRS